MLRLPQVSTTQLQQSKHHIHLAGEEAKKKKRRKRREADRVMPAAGVLSKKANASSSRTPLTKPTSFKKKPAPPKNKPAFLPTKKPQKR